MRSCSVFPGRYRSVPILSFMSVLVLLSLLRHPFVEIIEAALRDFRDIWWRYRTVTSCMRRNDGRAVEIVVTILKIKIVTLSSQNDIRTI